MRRTLPIALLIVIAVAPAAAHGAGLHLKRLARTSELPVASGGSGELAYLLSPTALRVRGPGRSARAYAVPAGCRPVGIATGVVALECSGLTADGDGSTRLAVLRERSGAIVAVRHPQDRFIGGLEAFGSRWMIVNGQDEGDGPRTSRRYLVEWSTGRAIEISGYLGGGRDPFGLAEYADLDAVEPIRRLCAPVTRSDTLSPVTRIGRWIALLGPQGTYQLRRCGTSRTLGSRSWSWPVLGREAVGYRLEGRRIVYRDLRSDARLTGRWPGDLIPHLAMYGRRLVVAEPSRSPFGSPSGDPPYTIYLGPDGF